MLKTFRNKNFLALLFIILFSTYCFFYNFNLQNSHYTTDSLFYKHRFYELSGNTFLQARDKVLQHNIRWNTEIENNIFRNPVVYAETYPFFKFRVTYPLIAYLLNGFFKSEFLAFLLPVFFSYIVLLVTLFFLFRKTLGILLTALSISLLATFAPFNVVTNNFMADNIVVCLLFLCVSIFIKLINKFDLKLLLLFCLLFIASVFTREQALFLIPSLVLFLIFYYIKLNRSKLRATVIVTVTTLLLGLPAYVYLIIAGAPTLYDSYQRIQNGYGHTNYIISTEQTMNFYFNSIQNNLIDLWTLIYSFPLATTLVLLSPIGIFYLIRKNKLKEMETLLITVSISTAAIIFIIPSFEIRYYVPLMIAVIYFSLRFLKEFFQMNEKVHP